MFNEVGFVAKRMDSVATIRARLMKAYSMQYICRVYQASMSEHDISILGNSGHTIDHSYNLMFDPFMGPFVVP